MWPKSDDEVRREEEVGKRGRGGEGRGDNRE